ncbi:MAG: efflux transporter outer membrane subunit, partial [Burkholderiales bacterium]
RGRSPALARRITLYAAGIDASGQHDFWGRNGRAIYAADARNGAAESRRSAAVLQVTGELVRSYVDLRAAQARLRSTRADAAAREAVARLVGERHRFGEAARFDALRADAQAKSVRAAIAGIEAQARAAAYRIALLIGQPPEALSRRLLADAPLPAAPEAVSAGLRSELLRRRPDIRQAERELAAATADVGTATADLFPRVSLLGSIGQQARSGEDLVDTGSTRFSFGPSLYWPLFDGGRIRARIRAADARAGAAAVRYERAVLGALSDSETALNRLDSARRTREDTEAARRQSADALVLARQRYEAGEDDLIALLQAQSAYSTAERASVDARANELQALVALYKALGGGWERFEPHPQ